MGKHKEIIRKIAKEKIQDKMIRNCIKCGKPCTNPAEYVNTYGITVCIDCVKEERKKLTDIQIERRGLIQE